MCLNNSPRGQEFYLKCLRHPFCGPLLQSIVTFLCSHLFDAGPCVTLGICPPLQVEREIAIMKLVNHPNVLGLYDVYENNSYL